MNHQIVDPRVPYIGPVGRGDFSPGKSIIIKGWPPSTANRFNINLQCGPATTPQYDIALQIAVNLLDGYITLNSFENGIWDEEQRGTLPIQCGKDFEIVITSDFLHYKVTIDGHHYAEFPHRIYYDRITHLAINGNVSISEISYDAVSRSEIEGISGYGVGAVPRASAPIPPKENDRYNPPPISDFPAPPSYEVTIESSKKAPYPISDPMSSMPYMSKNSGPDFLPYPTASSTDYQPTSTIGTNAPLGWSTVMPSPVDDPRGPRAIGIHAPIVQPRVIPSLGDDALVPLNIHSINTRPVQPQNGTWSLGFCLLMTITGIIFAMLIIVKFYQALRF